MELNVEVEKEINEIRLFRDRYFLVNPFDLIKNRNNAVDSKVNVALKLLHDAALPPFEKHFLTGQLLSLLSNNTTSDENAIRSFTAAVKLNPRSQVAWIELGEALWKNEDSVSAEVCFNTALKRQRTVEALRCLSSVARANGQMQHSLELAKEALAMDESNSRSLYIMANALLSYYLSSQQFESNILSEALQYYTSALKHQNQHIEYDPDVYYNMAVAQQCDEQFLAAIISLEHTLKLDPFMVEAVALLKVVKTYNESFDALLEKCRDDKLNIVRQNALGTFAGRLRCVRVSELTSANKDVVLVVGVFGSVPAASGLPMRVYCEDENHDAVNVTVYNCMPSLKLGRGQLIAIPEPFVKTRQCKQQWLSIRVDSPSKLLVDGKPLQDSYLACVNAKILQPHEAE